MTLGYAPATQEDIRSRTESHLRMILNAVHDGDLQFDASQGLGATVRIAPQGADEIMFTMILKGMTPEARQALAAMLKALDSRENTAAFVNRSDARRGVPEIAWRPGGVGHFSAIAKARIQVAVWSANPLQAHAAATSLFGHIEMLIANANSTRRPGEIGGFAASPTSPSSPSHERSRERAGDPVAIGGGF